MARIVRRKDVVEYETNFAKKGHGKQRNHAHTQLQDIKALNLVGKKINKYIGVRNKQGVDEMMNI